MVFLLLDPGKDSMHEISRFLTASLCIVVALAVVGCQSAGSKASPEEAKPQEPKVRSVSEIRSGLRDPDVSVRLAAVEELKQRAPSSQEAIDALVEALGNSEPLVRRFAAHALAEAPAVSSPMLLALSRNLQDPEVEPRESAAQALAALAPRAPAESVADLGSKLAAAVSDSQESVRTHAIEAIGGLGAAGARLVPAVKPALERALGDKSVRVRGAAAAALGQLGAGVPGTVALLTKALADPVHDVRKEAVIALEKMGPDAAPATKALVRQLRGKEIYLRVFAADALTAIGPRARAALPELKALVKRGWKDLEGSPEMEAKDLPAAVARAIASIEAKAPKVVKKQAGAAVVKGHFEEVNTGTFDLVDGIAWPASRGEGTVVYVVSKPITSAVLADSPCPMTLARSLTALRNAEYLEVTLDSAGKSSYFAWGTPFAGASRGDEVGGNSWPAKLRLAGNRAAGSVAHKDYGGFEFDLPLLSPKVKEVSEGDRSRGRRFDESAITPAEPAVTAAYRAVREAALKKDLNGLLAAQGFDQKQIAAIRGLEGIGADLAVYADRFLKPGTAGEFDSGAGYGSLRGEGANSKGAKFINYYFFAPCGQKLVLVSIGENPQ
jgi:HEAT repeat protein